jgi:selenoprotein W-related protein
LTQELLVHFKRDIRQLELRPSTGGCFEVSVDGKLIFSKLATQRFPEYQEIMAALNGADHEH